MYTLNSWALYAWGRRRRTQAEALMMMPVQFRPVLGLLVFRRILLKTFTHRHRAQSRKDNSSSKMNEFQCLKCIYEEWAYIKQYVYYIPHTTSFMQSKPNRIFLCRNVISPVDRYRIHFAQSDRIAPHWFEPAGSKSHVELLSESVYLVANEGRSECSNSQSEASREGLEAGKWAEIRSTTFSFGTQLFFVYELFWG